MKDLKTAAPEASASCTENDAREPEYYKTNRLLYIIEAAVEYFIALFVGSAYLAKLTTSIGMSDGLTGVLSSFISLGFGFQLLALFLSGKKKIKRTIILMHLINQLSFSMLYLIPVFDIPSGVKTVMFAAFLLMGEVLQNVIYSPKMTWLMSSVRNNDRGSFTAKKEIVSLISGVIISFGMGAVIDYFEAAGELNVAFIIGGITLFALTVIHTALLFGIKERVEEKEESVSVKLQIKEAVTDKNLMKLIPLFMLWNIAHYITTPFYGTYLQKELAFSMSAIALLSAVGALARALCSIPMGKFADRFSFVNMLTVCYTIVLIGYIFNIFAGGVFYIVYSLCHAIAMAGINSGTVNLVYDYVGRSKRTGTLAIKNTIAGFTGFFATLAARPLVDYIQGEGNRFLGIDGVYAQQVLSSFAAVIVVIIILYLNFVVRKMEKRIDKE